MNFPLTILLLLCVVGLRPTEASAQDAWRRIRLGDSTGDGSFGAALAIDSAYRVHLLYASFDGIYRQWYGRYEADTLRAPTLLETRSNGSFSLSTDYDLAEDSTGKLHAVVGVGMPSSCVRYAPVESDGLGPLEPLDASPCTAFESDPSIAVDAAGVIHLVFERERRIYYRRCDRFGVWSEEVRLSRDAPADAVWPSIVVAPNGTLHVTYQALDSERDSLFYVYGSSSSFTAPRAVCTVTGACPVPIHFDRRGDGHLVYLKPESSGRIRTILHAVLRNGVFLPGEPVATVDTSLYSLLQVWSAIDKSGSIHVMTTRYTLESPYDQSLLYTDDLSGSWAPLRNLTPDLSTRTVTAQLTAPIVLRDSMIALAYYAEERPGIYDATMLVGTFEFPPVISVTPDTIDFGAVPLDSCRTVTFWIHNAKEYSTDSLRSGMPSLFGVAPNALFTTQLDTARGIAPADSIQATLQFCPDESGAVSAMLVFDSNGGQDTLVVIGRGAEREPVPHLLRFDTAYARVGERAVLRCLVDPPLTARERISGIDLSISIEPRSLFPRRVVGGNPSLRAENLMMEYRAGRLELHGTSTVGMYLSGDTLFSLELEGLVTAVPHNPVRIDSSVLIGSPVLPDTRDGLVELAGCELGGLVGLARRGGILKIYPNPIGRDATLEYFALEGSRPELHISDPAGILVGTIPLPASRGVAQDVLLSLDGHPPGTYLVRLLVDRAVVGSVMVEVR